MKKLALLGLLLSCFFFIGCGNSQLGEGEEYYAENLIVAGVGPGISFESTVEEGTLVLKGSFEDHSDHIFLPAGTRENKFTEESDYLPGNRVKFEGYVSSLDAAAGNHYYEVVNIEKLELVKYPDADEIKNLFEGYNYCEKDSDCGYFVGECPLGCYIPLNVKYIDIASNIVKNFENHLGDDERCAYRCLLMNKAVCNDYKCEMIDAPAEADIHGCGGLYKDLNFNPETSCEHIQSPVCANDGKTYENDCYACVEPLVETYTFGECETDSKGITCTPEQKNADICTMQYEPVCGSDSRTYGNSCVACQSETVENYMMGECGSSAFTVEGNSDYLEEVMQILENDGAVSCDYSYNDNGTTVYGRFMSDGNRFYSAAENQDYVLATGDKTYFRSSSSASEKTVIDSPADIESEIASLLMDKGNYSDFQINCSGGIEDESLFKTPAI